MENGRNNPCTTMFFLIPKNVTSERADCADAGRSFESAGGGEVAAKVPR